MNDDVLAISNGLKIKYLEMNKLMEDCTFSEGIETIDIYIDSNQFFAFMRQEHTKAVADKLIKSKDSVSPAIAFFNLCGHYRNYFKTVGVSTRFFLIHSVGDTIKSGIYSDWNKEITEGYTDLKGKNYVDFVVLKRIRPMAEFLNDVYVINSVDVCHTTFPFILNEKKENRATFILSNDKRFLQYTYLLDKCAVMRPSAKNYRLVEASDIFNYIQDKLKNQVELTCHYLIPYLMLVGNKSIDPMDDSVKTASKAVKYLANGPKIEWDTYDNPELLREIMGSFVDEEDDIPNTLTLFDVPTLVQKVEFLDAWKTHIRNQVQSTPSKKSAFELNAEFFEDEINLSMLY
jgi:hypothetical protein